MYDLEFPQLRSALDDLVAGAEQLLTGLTAIKSLLAKAATDDEPELEPRDPANKTEIGGLMKLTPRGIEICYRLYDKGMSRYAVSQAMDISFGAATHRWHAWQAAGGLNRKRQEI